MRHRKYYQYNIDKPSVIGDDNPILLSEVQNIINQGFYIDTASLWTKEGSASVEDEDAGKFLAGFRLRSPVGHVIGLDICENRTYIYVPETLRSMITNLVEVEPTYEIPSNPDMERMLYDTLAEEKIT